MKKIVFIGVLAAAASLLNGCLIISCDEDHVVSPPCVVYDSPCAVVEIVPVPPCPPRPYWHSHHGYGRRW